MWERLFTAGCEPVDALQVRIVGLEGLPRVNEVSDGGLSVVVSLSVPISRGLASGGLDHDKIQRLCLDVIAFQMLDLVLDVLLVQELRDVLEAIGSDGKMLGPGGVYLIDGVVAHVSRQVGVAGAEAFRVFAQPAAGG